MVESKKDKKTIKVFLKNGIVFVGIFVSQDDKFLQLVNFKDGKLKIINLDQISDMEMDAEWQLVKGLFINKTCWNIQDMIMINLIERWRRKMWGNMVMKEQESKKEFLKLKKKIEETKDEEVKKQIRKEMWNLINKRKIPNMKFI